MSLAFIPHPSNRRHSWTRARVALRLEPLEGRLLPSLTPHLLRDINPGPGGSIGNQGFVAVNGVAYFPAFDPIHGTELWKSNATTAGTVLVKDIIPGSGGSVPKYLANVAGTLFFVEDFNGSLWKSNGTAAGTVLVKGFSPKAYGAEFSPDLTNVAGTLFFVADDGVHGRELWLSLIHI